MALIDFETLSEALVARLAGSALAASGGPAGTVSFDGKSIRRDHSSAPIGNHPRTAIFRMRTGGRPVAVKVYDMALGDKARAWIGRERDAFLRIEAAGPPALAPRLLASDVERGVLVMEWAAGRNLANHLRWANLAPARRRAAIAAAGAWLARFHAAGGQSQGLPRHRSVLARIDQLLDRARPDLRDRLMEDAGFAAALAGVRRRAADLDGAGATWTHLHGDFTPSNLIHTAGGELLGLDFGQGREGPAVYDMASFILRAAFLDWSAGAPGGLAGTDTCRAFLDGYGRLDEADAARLAWAMDAILVRRWVRYATRARDPGRAALGRLWDGLELARIRRTARAIPG